MLVELDDILHTLDEHGRLPAAAVADMLDLHAFDVRIALLGAATWGLVRRDGRGAWMLTERGRAAVSSDAPVAARPRPLHRARRPVLAAWALVAVAVVAVLAASWVSHPAAPSAGSEFSAAGGTTSRAFVGISGSRARRSRAALVPRLGALPPQQSTTAGPLPAYRTHSGPRVAAVVPRAIAGARPAAVVPARAARGNRVESVRPVPVLIRALRSGGHRVAAARLRTSRKRSAKHPAVAGRRPR
jgi:hypothetical protein